DRAWTRPLPSWRRSGPRSTHTPNGTHVAHPFVDFDMTRHLRLVVLLAASMSLLASRAGAQYATPRGQTISGIACDAQEGQRIHIHQHLAILDHGKPVEVPYDVGRPSGVPCLYWLHTHTPDGII